MAHSHPMETRGGAEIAALALFRALKKRGGRAWFLGVGGPLSEARLGSALSQPYGPDDYVYHPAASFDYFKFSNPDPNFPKAIGELVAELKPDIIHTHHFSRFGVELFSIIRRNSPTTKIVLSLHEFLAICNHHGQMVKTKTLRLCDRETYSACSNCFPEFSSRDFFLRKRYIQMFFDEVDLFISPSHFLADRFRAWGLPEAKLAVLENIPVFAGMEVAVDEGHGLPDPKLAVFEAIRPLKKPRSKTGDKSRDPLTEPAPRGVNRAPTLPAVPSALASSPMALSEASVAVPARAFRFGFFGQMSPLKGISVLMEAAKLLNSMDVDDAIIEIYGDYSNQPPAFQAVVTAALEEGGSNIVYHGAYDNKDVGRLMRRMDAVIVPSIWWENSPVVIQEALSNGRPVICSNIGGMAEKVIHGVNGLHFEAGRAISLAQLLAGIVQNPERLEVLTKTIARPATADVALDLHLQLYASLSMDTASTKTSATTRP
jgi:glycosyltransferase involved in cell wall biosynthesis